MQIVPYMESVLRLSMIKEGSNAQILKGQEER